MWIIDNSNNVLNDIKDFNVDNNIKNVNTYDFSTLYTNITHDDLKTQMKWVIDKAFHNKKYIYVNDYNVTWYKRNNTTCISKSKLLMFITYLIDNIYIYLLVIMFSVKSLAFPWARTALLSWQIYIYMLWNSNFWKL